MDNRVEPSTWFADGSGERSASGDAEARGGSYQPGAPAAHGNPARPSRGNVGSGSGMPEHDPDIGFSPTSYERAVPPYPAQIPPATGPGVAAKVTAQLAALTKPRPKPPPRVPERPGPERTGLERTGRSGPAPRVAVAGRPAAKGTPTRRAHLTVARIEPWSVMKFSFMVSLVGFVVFFVAVAFLYFVLSRLGVFHSLQSTITDVTSSKNSPGDDSGGQWFSAGRILGYTLFLGAINVVLFTALATVGAVIYNLVTHLAGGIEVTLRETD